MRNIRFRAWDKLRKEMKEVFTIDWQAKLVAIGSPQYIERFGSVEIMQYTGLHDKNGKEIYEGDIVEFIKTHNKKEYTGEVKYCIEVAGFMICSDDAWCSTEFGLGTTNIEIIGNIHENPELSK